MSDYLSKYLSRDLILGALVVAVLGMLGSLYFSEVAGFPPCVLCWYQRVALYPLVPVLAVGYILKDQKISYYALPLSVTGLFISVYHNLLYWKIIPESLAPCVQGISCTTKYISWFGFVTIPFLALLAFVAITVLLAVYWHLGRKENVHKPS